MQQFVQRWLLDPTVGKLVAAVLGITIVYILVRVLQRAIARYVQERDARYRARKFVSFLGYVAALLCW